MWKTVGLATAKAARARAVGRSPLATIKASPATFTAAPSFLQPALAHRGLATRAAPAATRKASSKTVTKTVAKTAAAKKKTKPAGTKAAAKSKPKPKVKAKAKTKPKLTDEEKTRLEIKALKQVALMREEPAQPNVSPYIIYAGERGKDRSLGQEGLLAFSKETAQVYKSLPTAEYDRLLGIAQQNKEVYKKTYKAWVESYPTAKIIDANRARSRLKRVFKVKGSRNYLIKDDRIPKKPSNGYFLFVKEKMSNGAFDPKKTREAISSLAAEWKSLSESQKKPWVDRGNAAMTEYTAVRKSLGFVAGPLRAASSPSPSA